MVVTAPTCDAKGYTTYTCTVCDDSYTADETAALGHAWDAGTVTKAAACAEEGVRTFTCTRDGSHTKTEAIPATGHIFDEWRQTKAPTEYDFGERRRECSVCHAVQTELVPKLPATALTLNKTNISLNYKDSDTIIPSEPVTWSSSNEKVVKVDANGKLTTVGKGTAVTRPTPSAAARAPRAPLRSSTRLCRCSSASSCSASCGIEQLMRQNFTLINLKMLPEAKTSGSALLV